MLSVAHVLDGGERIEAAGSRATVVRARIVPGDSGAPVVDGDGDVVGIVFARSTRRGGTAYAVRTDVAGALP